MISEPPAFPPLVEEQDKVEGWRLKTLLEAGYPIPLAERVAASKVDLHQAVDLVTSRGCPPDLAVEILL